MLSEIQNCLSAMKSRFFPGDPAEAEREAHREIYYAIVSASRAVPLYRDWKIGDHLDGRFDSLLAHFFIVTRILRERGEIEKADRLADWLMRDADRSLRQSGVTDHGIARKMRAVAEAYAGRMTAYTKAFDGLKTEGEAPFRYALFRNLYRTRPEGEPFADDLCAYLLRAYREFSQGEAVTPENIEIIFQNALTASPKTAYPAEIA